MLNTENPMQSVVQRKCRYCAEWYEVDRKHQLFCSGVCRRNWYYALPDTCFYCGDYGDHRDHIDPASLASFSKVRRFAHLELVKACASCNHILGKLYFPDIYFRFDYLDQQLSKKIKRRPRWYTGELDTLGPSLKRRVKHLIYKENKTEERLNFVRAMKAVVAGDTEIEDGL